jgi:hypothetical protein
MVMMILSMAFCLNSEHPVISIIVSAVVSLMLLSLIYGLVFLIWGAL